MVASAGHILMRSLLFFRGWGHLEAGHHEEAIPFFEHLVKLGLYGSGTPPAAHQVRIIDEYACDALATCYFKMGNYSKARDCYDQAGRHAPDNIEYRVKEELCRALYGQQDHGRPRPSEEQ